MRLIDGLLLMVAWTELNGTTDLAWYWIAILVIWKLVQASYYLVTAGIDEDKFEGI